MVKSCFLVVLVHFLRQHPAIFLPNVEEIPMEVWADYTGSLVVRGGGGDSSVACRGFTGERGCSGEAWQRGTTMVRNMVMMMARF